MSEHRAEISWARGEEEFTYETYPRDHTWSFPGSISVRASAAPAYQGNPELVDPEQAFVAALASCHMLTFLALAARKRYVVERYEDAAMGFLEKNERGRLAITRIVLHPRVTFGDSEPSAETLQDLHERAHGHCFLANSVLTSVEVEPS